MSDELFEIEIVTRTGCSSRIIVDDWGKAQRVLDRFNDYSTGDTRINLDGFMDRYDRCPISLCVPLSDVVCVSGHKY